ncbi:MAG: hypothetical protein ACTSYR_02400, partial [Candidatus Odinarchaeia archaeon]
AVTYKTKDFITLLGFEGNNPEILNENDQRITAILWQYTSRKYSCEFYDSSLNSKCKLDPNTYRIIDCEGRKYRKGIICPYLDRLYNRNNKNSNK